MQTSRSAPAVYLASQSPRRSQLLTQIGISHALLLPDAGDPYPGDSPQALEALEAPLAQEAARDYVQRVTALKLQAARQRAGRRGLPARPIVCADTTVALGSAILGKPADREDAGRMLMQLSGRRHEVLTAVAIADGEAVSRALSVSQVHFAALDASQLAHYLDSNEWQGKAGAYAIQGQAATMVAWMEGSFSGIMGLPLFETYQLLRPLLKAQNGAIP